MQKRNQEPPVNPLLVHARFSSITHPTLARCQCASHSVHNCPDLVSHRLDFFEDVLQELAFLKHRGSDRERKALWQRAGSVQDKTGLHCYHKIVVCFRCVDLLIIMHMSTRPTYLNLDSSFLLIRDRLTWNAGIIPVFPASIVETDILATLRQGKLVYT